MSYYFGIFRCLKGLLDSLRLLDNLRASDNLRLQDNLRLLRQAVYMYIMKGSSWKRLFIIAFGVISVTDNIRSFFFPLMHFTFLGFNHVLKVCVL